MKNGLHIDEHGNKCWYLDDKLHRQDGPAEEWANGTKLWYLHDKLHRQDGPAVEWANGTKHWYLDGKYLGNGDAGFWDLWELLTDEKRNRLNLHMHLPGLKISCKKNPAGV
jgi:hypothetical protein